MSNYPSDKSPSNPNVGPSHPPPSETIPSAASDYITIRPAEPSAPVNEVNEVKSS